VKRELLADVLTLALLAVCFYLTYCLLATMK